MTADELRDRIQCLGLSHAEAARRLGLSPNGLYKQTHGERRVSRQTELLLECIEKHQPRRVDRAGHDSQTAGPTPTTARRNTAPATH